VILRRTGDTEVRTGLHYLYNWAQDDRAQQKFDNATTREVYEDHIKDGHLTVLGWDATVRHATLGYFGAGASYIKGDNVYTLRGLSTFGGEGQNLTDRWWDRPPAARASCLPWVSTTTPAWAACCDRRTRLTPLMWPSTPVL